MIYIIYIKPAIIIFFFLHTEKVRERLGEGVNYKMF